MSREKILIVEDDADIVEVIDYNLKKEGYRTTAVFNGEDALSCAEKEEPDLMILDLMLPGMDGLEVCRILREKEKTTHIPVIMLTAKSQEIDKIVGLELGADDYITKPFSPRELIARIKAILRRSNRLLNKKITKVGSIVIDSLKHKVMISGRSISLTPTEFKLLELLAKNPGVVLSRSQILEGVFGYDSESYDRTVDAHMKSLRKKMGKARDCIETIRGLGYRLEEL